MQLLLTDQVIAQPVCVICLHCDLTSLCVRCYPSSLTGWPQGDFWNPCCQSHCVPSASRKQLTSAAEDLKQKNKIKIPPGRSCPLSLGASPVGPGFGEQRLAFRASSLFLSRPLPPPHTLPRHPDKVGKVNTAVGRGRLWSGSGTGLRLSAGTWDVCQAGDGF